MNKRKVKESKVDKVPAEAEERLQRVIVAKYGKPGRNPEISILEITPTEYNSLQHKGYDFSLPMFNPEMYLDLQSPELDSMLQVLNDGLTDGSFPPHPEIEEWLDLLVSGEDKDKKVAHTDNFDLNDQDPPEMTVGRFAAEPGELVETEEDPYLVGFLDGLHHGTKLTQENLKLAVEILQMAQKQSPVLPSVEKSAKSPKTEAVAQMLRKIKPRRG